MKELMRRPAMQPDASAETVAQAGATGPAAPPAAGAGPRR